MTGRRFRTSLWLQLREYRTRLLPLFLVALLPVGFWAATFFSVPPDAEPIPQQRLEPYAAVIGPISVAEIPEADTWPVDTMLMGVAWALAAAALFSVVGSGARDRRLVLAGFRPWEIMTARLLILLLIAVPVSLLPVAVIAGFSTLTPPNIGLVWVGSFFAAAVGAAIGLIVGSLLPRQLEGTILLIGIIGVEVSIPFSVTFRHYLPLFGPHALFLAGRFTSEPIVLVPVLRSLAWAAGYSAFAIFLWTRRVRIFHASASPAKGAGISQGTS